MRIVEDKRDLVMKRILREEAQARYDLHLIQEHGGSDEEIRIARMLWDAASMQSVPPKVWK